MQAHEREKAERLGLVGHEPDQQRREPFGVLGEVARGDAAGAGAEVALVEREVEDREHFFEPVG